MNDILYLHDVAESRQGKIAANYSNTLLMSEFETIVSQKNISLITADDGYKNIIKTIPQLEKHKKKIVIFITTGFINNTTYPYEVELSNILEKKNEIYSSHGELKKIKTKEDKNKAFQEEHRKIKKSSQKRRNMLMNALAEKNKINRNDFQQDIFLDWNDIRELSKHPLVSIGSHCVSHIYLTRQAPYTIFKELYESRQEISQQINRDIDLLSYPYGANNKLIQKIAQLCGYRKAYGTTKKSHSKYSITRIDANSIAKETQ